MNRQSLVLVAAVVGSMAAIAWFGFLRGIVAGRQLLSLPLGTDRSTVVAVLGDPDEVRGTFRLAQQRLYEREYESAAASGAVEFLVWEYLLDTVCCAGFDTQSKLVVRACGTT